MSQHTHFHSRNSSITSTGGSHSTDAETPFVTAHGSSNESPKGSVIFVKRHPLYYIDAGDLHILAGRTLFRVHSYFFSRESPIFNKRLNPVSPGDVREGTTDSDPVILEDVTAEEFECFCWVFYNPKYSLYNASITEWSIILNLAHKWDFPQIKELVVRQLHLKPSVEFPLHQKLALYEQYHVDIKSVIPLYVELCVRDRPLTLEECRVLGMEASWLVGVVRERVRVSGGTPRRDALSAASEDGNSGWRSPLPEGVDEEFVYKAVEEQLKIQEEEKEKEKEKESLSSSIDRLSLNDSSIYNPTSPTGSRPSTIKLRNLGHGGTLGKRGGAPAPSLAGRFAGPR
ncbi:hypothetical protein CPC08DRAFT_709869 [Agrocybe pediades]|nr:hypothetical protein CPC08DRAFT_709869 [Agrocybe pediades]